MSGMKAATHISMSIQVYVPHYGQAYVVCYSSDGSNVWRAAHQRLMKVRSHDGQQIFDG